MLLDGIEGDHELARDGPVRPAGRQHLEHLQLTAGELIDQGRDYRDPAPPGIGDDVLHTLTAPA